MKTVSYLMAGLVGAVGFVLLMGSSQGHTTTRIIIGVVLIGVAVFFIYLARSKGPQVHITHDIDLTGDVSPETMRCKSCDAQLDADSIELREGAIYVKCPYCGSEYHMEEKPKW